MVLSQIHPLPPIELPLTDAYGCVAAADITAAVDLPEFASSGMDGFAVRAADVAGAAPGSPVELKVVGRALIGHRPDATVGMGESVEIATGAPIPSGADAVVPIENAEATDEGDLVRLFDAVPAGRHVRPQGEDVAAGAVLVPAGKRLRRSRDRPARERRRPASARASTAARDRLLHGRRARSADRDPVVRTGSRCERLHVVRRAPRGRGDAGARRHRPRRPRGAEGGRLQLRDPGGRVRVVGWRERRRARRREGGVLQARRHRVLQGRDAAGDAAGVRVHRGQAVLRAARATP